MSVLSTKQLKKALDKARNSGQVEEPCMVMGLSFVLRNLRSDEYLRIQDSIGELDGSDYLVAFRTEHLCRSIVAIEDQDLRGVEYIEVEEETDTGIKKVKLEKHAFLRDEVLSTWSKEMTDTAFHKFLDVVHMAEERAKEGVTFVIPDEAPEDKFRRLLLELKETEESLPAELVKHILLDSGLVHTTTRAELEGVDAKLSKLSNTLEVVEPTEQPSPPPAPLPKPVEVAPPREIQAQVASPPAPPPQAVQRPQSLPPVQFRQAPPMPPEEPRVNPRTPPPTSQVYQGPSTRSAYTAALEGLPGLPGVASEEPVSATPEVLSPVERRDPKKVVLDPPPPAGINPRFRPPRKP